MKFGSILFLSSSPFLYEDACYVRLVGVPKNVGISEGCCIETEKVSEMLRDHRRVAFVLEEPSIAAQDGSRGGAPFSSNVKDIVAWSNHYIIDACHRYATTCL